MKRTEKKKLNSNVVTVKKERILKFDSPKKHEREGEDGGKEEGKNHEIAQISIFHCKPKRKKQIGKKIYKLNDNWEKLVNKVYLKIEALKVIK